jgi:hypothetical protein
MSLLYGPLSELPMYLVRIGQSNSFLLAAVTLTPFGPVHIVTPEPPLHIILVIVLAIYSDIAHLASLGHPAKHQPPVRSTFLQEVVYSIRPHC